MPELLEIQLSTDVVTGDLQIDFHPIERHTIPVGIEDWVALRRELRLQVRAQLNATDAWIPYLDSNRLGEGLCIEVGYVTLDDDGSVIDVSVRATEPEEVDW